MNSILKHNHILIKNKFNPNRISRQGIRYGSKAHRSFLLLELLIALFLIGLCVLPLASLPSWAIKEEIKSAYRLQAQRLADLGFAKIKEDFYKKQIPWKEIVKSSKEGDFILDEVATVAIDPFGERKFTLRGKLQINSKKGQNEEEWHLVTVRIKVQPQDKSFKLFLGKKNEKHSRSFVYQVLINQATPSLPISEIPEVAGKQ